MSGKNTIYYVNTIITEDAVEDLNQHFANNEYKYKCVIFWLVVDLYKKNFKINIPLSVENVIVLINFTDELDPKNLFKIPFNCKYTNITKTSFLNKETITKDKLIKLQDIIDDFSPKKYKFELHRDYEVIIKTIKKEHYLLYK
jgi:hypothetical protein